MVESFKLSTLEGEESHMRENTVWEVLLAVPAAFGIVYFGGLEVLGNLHDILSTVAERKSSVRVDRASVESLQRAGYIAGACAFYFAYYFGAKTPSSGGRDLELDNAASRRGWGIAGLFFVLLALTASFALSDPDPYADDFR